MGDQGLRLLGGFSGSTHWDSLLRAEGEGTATLRWAVMQ